MSNISPKVIDVEGTRIGDYVETRNLGDINNMSKIYGGGKGLFNTIKPSYKTGRFPTQLFTNINDDKYKYIKRI